MTNQAVALRSATPSWLSSGEDYVLVRVVARPGSPRLGIIRLEPRGIVAAVNAQPEKGRANAELVELFARLLHVPKSSVTIAHGESARIKTIRIATTKASAVVSALSAAAQSCEK
jgi:uncharacterized protein (TIGR00251 family)